MLRFRLNESIYKTNTKDDILDSIVTITNAYSNDRLFSELRKFLQDIEDIELKDILTVLINESDANNDDSEMVYSILSSEIESYYRLKGVNI